MSLLPYPVEDFGVGLQLKDRQGSSEGALDLSDVWYPVRGRVAERPGSKNVLANVTGSNIHSVGEHRDADGSRKLLVGHGTKLQAYDTGGAAHGAEAAGLTDGAPLSFARIGTPAIDRTYVANGVDVMRHFDGDAWAVPNLTGQAGVGTGKHVAVYQHRLVNANFVGVDQDRNPSAIRFSDVANPDIFAVNNFVRITPGDGEAIMGMGAWRDWLFAPKETKIAVFYGIDDDFQGNPIFHREMVDTGIGMAGHGACCVGPDGFYFLGRQGIYRMQGMDPPERISQAIDPIFEGTLPTHYDIGGGGKLNHSKVHQVRMTWHDDRLYVAFATGETNDRMLMWDPKLDAWTLWRVAAAGLVSFRAGAQPELHFAVPGNTRQVRVFQDGLVNDQGVAIGSYWLGSYTPLAEDGTVVVRQVLVTGSGKMKVQVGADYQLPGGGATIDLGGTVDTWGGGAAGDDWEGGADPTDTWGPTPEFASDVARIDTVRGRRHALKFSSATAGRPWAVDQAVIYHTPPSRRRREVRT